MDCKGLDTRLLKEVGYLKVEENQITVQWVNFKRLPIPLASESEKEPIIKLVQKCLDAKGVNCEEWEKEIDERVAALYGL
jgi:hypothetical protein